ncbi:hypothetical protein PG990_000745 [Apiospora arundinis]
MNWKKLIVNFIDDIPDEKLEGFRLVPGNLYHDNNFRLNMQGMTVTGEYNLQIQINYECEITSIKNYAPNTVAGPVLVAQSYVNTSKTDANSEAGGKTAANQKGNDKKNINRNGANPKNAGGKSAADQKGMKDDNNKSNGKAASGKAANESDNTDESDTPDPAAIRKAFKATIRPINEIVGPGQKVKQGKKGGKK